LHLDLEAVQDGNLPCAIFHAFSDEFAEAFHQVPDTTTNRPVIPDVGGAVQANEGRPRGSASLTESSLALLFLLFGYWLWARGLAMFVTRGRLTRGGRSLVCSAFLCHHDDR
jgi:hypothetical protein